MSLSTFVRWHAGLSELVATFLVACGLTPHAAVLVGTDLRWPLSWVGVVRSGGYPRRRLGYPCGLLNGIMYILSILSEFVSRFYYALLLTPLTYLPLPRIVGHARPKVQYGVRVCACVYEC